MARQVQLGVLSPNKFGWIVHIIMSYLNVSLGEYEHMEQLLGLDACCPANPVHLPSAMGAISTPLNWREWDQALASHPDQRLQSYIVNGLCVSFQGGIITRHRVSRVNTTLHQPQQTWMLLDYLVLKAI